MRSSCRATNTPRILQAKRLQNKQGSVKQAFCQMVIDSENGVLPPCFRAARYQLKKTQIILD